MWSNREDESASRIFSRHMKEECWKRARIVPGRNPDRWRYDAAGNIVNAVLRGCLGCLCHEYDHIIPYSKGGETAIENCQILQTRVNRMKGNDDDYPEQQQLYSCSKKWSEHELDLMEMALYGNVHREGLRCRCKSLAEFEESIMFKIPRRLRNIPGCPD